MLVPVASFRVHWLTPEEGGRRTLPSGPSYASVAHFASDSLDESFSVVLRFDPSRISNTCQDWDVELTLLAPENLPEVAARFKPGARLAVTEGAKEVANGEIQSVRMAVREELPAPFSPDTSNFRPDRTTAS